MWALGNRHFSKMVEPFWEEILTYLDLFMNWQYTHSGKKVEVAVKKILAGEDITQRGAFANPDSLDIYYNLPNLQGFWDQ